MPAWLWRGHNCRCPTFHLSVSLLPLTWRPAARLRHLLGTVRTFGANVNRVRLKGTWGDAPRAYAEPVHVILRQGGQPRALPVDAIEVEKGMTTLRCKRHPGFTYDRTLRVWREKFAPLNTVRGAARVTLPSRLVLTEPAGK